MTGEMGMTKGLAMTGKVDCGFHRNDGGREGDESAAPFNFVQDKPSRARGWRWDNVDCGFHRNDGGNQGGHPLEPPFQRGFAPLRRSL